MTHEYTIRWNAAEAMFELLSGTAHVLSSPYLETLLTFACGPVMVFGFPTYSALAAERTTPGWVYRYMPH